MHTSHRWSLKLFVLFMVALAVTLPLALGSPVALAQTLVVETADGSANTVGKHSSLALDASGNPSVTYYDGQAFDLKYARKSGGIWTSEIADGSATVLGEYTALALDSSGDPHVSYLDNTLFDLKYARKSGGVWTREIVDASANAVGFHNSLAVDALGNPHLSYQDATIDNLKYARKSGGVWTIETADGSANDVGSYTSLALDASGNPHVGYKDDTTDDVKYARKSGGVWTLETVEASANDVGSFISLALDASGNPHVSYWDATNSDLRYARKSGGVWTRETVVGSANDVGWYTSIELDGAENPHISFHDVTTGDLRYARRAGGLWTIETLDGAASIVGAYTSLELDAAERPHVSYFDATAGDLKYAFVPSLIVSAPGGGATWAVGSTQTISWSYTGGLPVDISDVHLSVDGGRTYDLIVDNTRDFGVTIRVPHSPTRFARIKIVQPSPFTVGVSDSFFAIDAAIALAKFDARAIEGTRDVSLAWKTSPGPEADVRYRVERADGGAAAGAPGAVFTPLHAGLLDRGEYVDRTAALDGESGDASNPATAGARYRLIAVNGLGEEYVLGEREIAPSLGANALLSAYPNPARGGETRVAYRVATDALPIDLAVYDVSGRRVKTLASGTRPTGVGSIAWDGRDDGGRDVTSGTYFLRLAWGANAVSSTRVVVAR
ncbi:MAG: FlgD immunoglobulin-like domain containing protein [bacterium]